MTREEIRGELAPILEEARALLESSRFYEVSYAVGDDLERLKFKTTEEAFGSYNEQVEGGNRDVAVSAKTARIEFRGVSYYPFLLALFNTFQNGRIVPTMKWPYKKVDLFNERVINTLTKSYVEGLSPADSELARAVRSELIAGEADKEAVETVAAGS